MQPLRVNVLMALVVVLVLIQVFLSFVGGVERLPEFYLLFGLSWEGVSRGMIWQFVSHALVHGNWLHLMVNVLMLWLVGRRVICILGCRKWGEVVLAGVLGGGVLHVLTGVLQMWQGYPESHLVGISGACVALLLTLTALSPDLRMWPVPVSGRSLGLGVILAELILWLMQPGLGLPVFSSIGEWMVVWVGPGLFQVSHACHLGGALVGWWLARRLLSLPPSLEDLREMREAREGGDAGDVG